MRRLVTLQNEMNGGSQLVSSFLLSLGTAAHQPHLGQAFLLLDLSRNSLTSSNAQRHVSWVIQNPVELRVEMNSHRPFCPRSPAFLCRHNLFKAVPRSTL